MSFTRNILKARSHIAFIIGLCLAAMLVISLDNSVGYTRVNSQKNQRIIESQNQTKLVAQHDLTNSDLETAKIAWQYFAKNYNLETGLVNSVNEFPSTTIWDQSSYLLGLISAYKIGIITQETFDSRVSQNLSTLSKLPLFFGKLPNKVYNTKTLMMTDYTNQHAPNGVGWSALDVARITVPLNILLYDFPEHAELVTQVLSRWNFESMLNDGVLLGARLNKKTRLPETIQEGRLGYEEYAARAISLLGLDALRAARYDDFIKFEDIAGQRIAADSRSFALFDAPNYVVSEPYILMAIEFGLDSTARELAHRIYRAQESRYNSSGQLTAVSEDNIDQAPYFIYNTVYANGTPWNAVSEDGSVYPDLKTISTKAVFGWDALYQTDYTQRLVKEIQKTKTENHGWQSGIYEKDGRVNAVSTANTNGIILEIINYKANGPLLSGRFTKGAVDD